MNDKTLLRVGVIGGVGVGGSNPLAPTIFQWIMGGSAYPGRALGTLPLLTVG